MVGEPEQLQEPDQIQHLGDPLEHDSAVFQTARDGFRQDVGDMAVLRGQLERHKVGALERLKSNTRSAHIGVCPKGEGRVLEGREAGGAKEETEEIHTSSIGIHRYAEVAQRLRSQQGEPAYDIYEQTSSAPDYTQAMGHVPAYQR